MIRRTDYIEYIDAFLKNGIASRTGLKGWTDMYLFDEYKKIIDAIYAKIHFCDNANPIDECKLSKITQPKKKVLFDVFYDLLFFYSEIKDTELCIESSRENTINGDFEKLKQASYASTGFSEESTKKLLSKEGRNPQMQLSNRDGRKYRFIITTVIPQVLGENCAVLKDLSAKKGELILDRNIGQLELILNQYVNVNTCISEIELHKFAQNHFKFYFTLLSLTSVNSLEIINKAIKSTYKMVDWYQANQANNDSLSNDAICEVFTFVMMNDAEVQNISSSFFMKGE